MLLNLGEYYTDMQRMKQKLNQRNKKRDGNKRKLCPLFQQFSRLSPATRTWLRHYVIMSNKREENWISKSRSGPTYTRVLIKLTTSFQFPIFPPQSTLRCYFRRRQQKFKISISIGDIMRIREIEISTGMQCTILSHTSFILKDRIALRNIH